MSGYLIGPSGVAPPLTGIPANPLSIFGSALSAWYNPTIISNSAGAVTSWPDQSGNGAHLSNVVASPTYSATAFNGRPGITLDGTSQYLSTSTYNAPSSGTGSMAFWMVFNPTATPVAFGRFLSTIDDTAAHLDYRGTNCGVPFALNNTSTAIAAFADVSATPSASFTISYGTNFRASMIWDGTNITSYLSNVQQAQSANANPTAWGQSGVNLLALCVGTTQSNSGSTLTYGTDFAKGVIAEVVAVKGGVTSQNLIDMDAWLKYNNGL